MHHTTRSALLQFSCAAACALGALMPAQAAVLKENFNAAFPAWESRWFALNSDATNGCAVTYCLVGDVPTPPSNTVRGNAGDGLWLSSETGISSFPITITFEPTFGASLKAFKLDVAAYVKSTLLAWDMDGKLIFSRKLKIDDYRDIPTSNYQSIVIRSSNGIASFSITGYADGNTAIDNLIAVTRGSADELDGAAAAE